MTPLIAPSHSPPFIDDILIKYNSQLIAFTIFSRKFNQLKNEMTLAEQNLTCLGKGKTVVGIRHNMTIKLGSCGTSHLQTQLEDSSRLTFSLPFSYIYLLPSPVHAIGFFFCSFPYFLAIFILLSLNNQTGIFYPPLERTQLKVPFKHFDTILCCNLRGVSEGS